MSAQRDPTHRCYIQRTAGSCCYSFAHRIAGAEEPCLLSEGTASRHVIDGVRCLDVHPTATVSAGALIAGTASVGPYAVVRRARSSATVSRFLTLAVPVQGLVRRDRTSINAGRKA